MGDVSYASDAGNHCLALTTNAGTLRYEEGYLLCWSSRIMHIVLRNALTAAVYFFVGKAALSLAFLHPSITVVWPSTGVAIAACLLGAYRVWPGVLVGAFLVNQTTMGTVLTSATIAAGNTLEALLGAYLLNRFASGRRAFWQAEGVLTFTVLVAVLSTTVSATIGVTSLALAGDATGRPLDLMWLTWWLGDATGALIVTPVVVLWSSPVPLAGPPRRRWKACSCWACSSWSVRSSLAAWRPCLRRTSPWNCCSSRS